MEMIYAILLPLILVVTTLVLVQFLALFIATKLLKFEKQDFVTALIVAGLCSFVGFICFFTSSFILYFISPVDFILILVLSVALAVPIYAITGLMLIKYLYKTGWRNAVIAFSTGFVAVVLFSGIAYILLMLLFPWLFGTVSIPTPTSECKGFSQIQPVGWVAYNTGEFTLVLINNAGTKQIIKQDGVNVTIGGQPCASGPTGDISIDPGDKKQINIAGCDGITGYPEGDVYRAKIVISYINSASGMSHISSGICWGPVE